MAALTRAGQLAARRLGRALPARAQQPAMLARCMASEVRKPSAARQPSARLFFRFFQGSVAEKIREGQIALACFFTPLPSCPCADPSTDEEIEAGG